MANLAVLTSGGVDSSVALYELKEKSTHNITAYYLKIWLEDELAFLGSCPWEEDLKQVTKLCSELGIPLEVISLQKEYHDKVVDYVVKELRQGRTPSPDLLCNQFIKFKAFYEKAETEIDYVATGHYAKVCHEGEASRLLTAKDPIKDQTYFLSLLDQKQISKCVFPLGGYLKTEVRELAKRYKLSNADRPDSQGICFLGKIKYDDFVRHHLGEKKGPIVDIDTGDILGQHSGYWFHTTGQRRGLDLSGGPWYVYKKDHESNTVFIRHQKFEDKLGFKKFEVSNLNCISPIDDSIPMEVKVRHGAKKYPAIISEITEGQYLVDIEETDKGISPGQFCVLYQKDVCIGGSVINRIHT